jgi:Kef-type K+ transport system membrane component KefB
VIDGVSEPFFAVFFLLAGFKLELHTLTTLGVVGAVYVVVRALGLISGGYLSGALVGANEQVRRRIGFCILPQAGVALGFALLVQERIPEIGSSVLNLVIATTVLFEITGPLIARFQLQRAGELVNGAPQEANGNASGGDGGRAGKQ